MAAQHNPVDREQARESINTLRVLGGLLLAVGLLLYFFHLAEAWFGGALLGALGLGFVAAGVILLVIGWRRMRALR
jgi:hypothetical protein